VRLLCFHHAGGSAASFNSWSRALPDWIDVHKVQLPGRDPAGPRRPHTDVAVLIPELRESLAPLLVEPFALYGHSLGALVAFELARALRAHGGPEPLALFVSGRRAPQVPLSMTALCDLPEERLIPRLVELGGLSPELIRKPEWLRYFIPVMRADLEVSDHYAYTADAPLACPLFAFKGADDPIVSESDFVGWRAQAGGAFEAAVLPGRHFLPPDAVALLQAAIAAKLGELTARAVPA
jgi:medium-chain acyl-[acyl-carrier-protein] hydrolase